MAITVAGLSPVLAPVYSPTTLNRKPINFHKPHLLSYKQNPSSTTPLQHRSRTVLVIEEGPRKQRNRLFSVFGSLTDPEEEEEEPKDSSEGQVASVDIKLPRRSLQVEFSCNSCGERTKRLINRLAYERGLVFVQCGGCLKHHKLVDNLGLIVEYDFRKDSSTDQI
ncbi:DNL-type domain-containing protein [Hirschfeldia incana]|nr:DNL-type domain-containing protein [Hirschfeldia incana]